MSEIDLTQFYGTEAYHPTSFRTMSVTDGVHYLREKAKCYWLIDVIESWNMCDTKVKGNEFQVWKFVKKEKGGVITCEDGNNNEIARQEIEYTDFPMDRVTLWVSGDVIMLPSEY